MRTFFQAAVLPVTFLVCTASLAQEPDSSRTLREQLESTNAGFAERMPAEVMQSIDDAVRQVAESGILEDVVGEGERAPDFTLPDATGRQVRLYSLLEEGPVVLTWYRGNW